MLERTKAGGRYTTGSGFNPNSPALRKADIIDYINTHYPHATIPTKAKLSDLRQTAKDLMASDPEIVPSSSELTSTPDSEEQCPSKPDSYRISNQRPPHPSTPPKSHGKPTNVPSTARCRSTKKPYSRPTTPSKSYRSKSAPKVETSPSPTRGHPPPTPSQSSRKTVQARLHKQLVSNRVKRSIPEPTIAARKQNLPSSHSSRMNVNSTFQHNKHRSRSSREAISRKNTSRIRSPSDSSNSNGSEDSSSISICSESTHHSTASDEELSYESGSGSTSPSRDSIESYDSSAQSVSKSKLKSSLKQKKSKAQLQKLKKKKNDVTQSRRVTFAKSPPKVKSVKKSPAVVKKMRSQSRRTGAQLDSVEKGRYYLESPRINLDPHGLRNNFGMESNRFNSSESHRENNQRYTSLLDEQMNRDFNESFFTPASLSYYSDNPYQARPNSACINMYPYLPGSTKTFSHHDKKQPTTSNSNHFNYSPVAFYNPLDPTTPNQPAYNALAYQQGGTSDLNSSAPPWNSKQPPQAEPNHARNVSSHSNSHASYGYAPHTCHSHLPHPSFPPSSASPSTFPIQTVNPLPPPPPKANQSANVNPNASVNPHYQHVPQTRTQAPTWPPPSNPLSTNGMSTAQYPNNAAKSYHPPTPAPTPSVNNSEKAKNDVLGASPNSNYHPYQSQHVQNPNFHLSATAPDPLVNKSDENSPVYNNPYYRPSQSASLPPPSTSFPSPDAYHQINHSSTFQTPATTTEYLPPAPKAISFQTGILCPMAPTKFSFTLPHQASASQNPDHSKLNSHKNQPSACDPKPTCNTESGFKFMLPLSSAQESIPHSHGPNSPNAGRWHNPTIPALSLTSPTPPSVNPNSLTKTVSRSSSDSSNYLTVPQPKPSDRETKNVKQMTETRTSNSQIFSLKHAHADQPSSDGESAIQGHHHTGEFDEIARGILANFLDDKEKVKINDSEFKQVVQNALSDLLRNHETNLKGLQQTAAREQTENKKVTTNPIEDQGSGGPPDETKETKIPAANATSPSQFSQDLTPIIHQQPEKPSIPAKKQESCPPSPDLTASQPPPLTRNENTESSQELSDSLEQKL